MIRSMFRNSMPAALAVGMIVCGAVVAQNQGNVQKLDAAALANAPTVGQLVVDSDGTLHFGPRTVPPAALASPEARQAYTRQMMQRAQASAAKGGLASVRTTGANPTSGAGAGKAAALKIYPVVEEELKIGGVGVTVY